MLLVELRMALFRIIDLDVEERAEKVRAEGVVNTAESGNKSASNKKHK